jgi:hypothetical protein
VIRSVVFDVGGVLVRLRYQPFVDYLAAAGIDMSSLPAWLERVGLAAHERGEITGEDLLDRVAAMATRPLDPAELRSRATTACSCCRTRATCTGGTWTRCTGSRG